MGSKTDNYEVEASTDETFGFPCARKSCSYIGPRLRILYPALPYGARRNEVMGELTQEEQTRSLCLISPHSNNKRKQNEKQN